MFETVLDTLGTTGAILVGFIVLYFITRVPWWLPSKICVPSTETVEAVRINAPGWRKRADGWFSTFPDLTVNGFFCSLLWPVTVALNLLLLAQVLEIFFPGGERVVIPKMGSYTYLSLLAGALYSIAQTVFGVTAGESGKDKKALASFFVLLLLATIGGEMGLAGYRAREIEKGLQTVGPTMMDQTFSQGIVLTMFLSFIVPVAHSVLGFIALPRFIGPLVGYLPRLAGGLFIYLWSYFAQFFFGFQKIRTLPVATSALFDQSHSAANSAQGLTQEIKEKSNAADKFREIEKRWRELQDDIDNLLTGAKALPAAWQQEADAIGAGLTSAQADAAFASLDQRLRSLQGLVERAPKQKFQHADALIERLRRLAKEGTEWRVQLHALQSTVPTLKKSLAGVENMINVAEAEADTQSRILSPQKDQEAVAILTPGHAELREIHRVAMDFGNRRTQKDAAGLHGVCMKALTGAGKEMNDARATLAPAAGQIALLEQKIAGLVANPPVGPTEDELTQRESQLRQCQRDVISATPAFAVTLRAINKRYTDATRGLHKATAGPKKRFWLVRFFVWMGQKWSNFIDMIVRSKPEEKKKPEPPAAASAAAVKTRGEEEGK